MGRNRTITVRYENIRIKIYPTPTGKYKGYTVTWYDGGRKRKQFSRQAAAKEFALSQAILLHHPCPTTKPLKVKAVVEAMLQAKKQDNCSPRHLQDLESRLGKLARYFDCPISEVTPTHLDLWLRNLSIGPRTRNNYRGACCNLWSWALGKGYVSSNIANSTSSAQEPHGQVGIFTPSQMKILLSTAATHYPKLIPLLALGGFCGLRTSEVEALSWNDVDLVAGVVKVRKESKTGRRVVPIPENARCWLVSYRNSNTTILPLSNVANALRRLSVRSGVDWVHNGLRHSFCSYRLAVVGEAGKVAEEAGNSVRVMRESYLELVTKRDGEEWFKL